MVDPTTAIAAAKTLGAGAKLGKQVWDKGKGLSSYGKASTAVEAVAAEQVAADERRMIASAVVAELNEVLRAHDWQSQPDEEQPIEHDLESAAADLIREARRAGSHRKREVLFRAFFMRFDPELFKEGLGRLLWDIVCDLEYPALRALKRAHDVEHGADKSGRRATMPMAFFKKSEEHWPHLARLTKHGLVWSTESGPATEGFKVTCLGTALLRFAWDGHGEPEPE